MKKLIWLSIIVTVIFAGYTQAGRIAPTYTIMANEAQVRHSKPIIYRLGRHIGYNVTNPPGIIVIKWGKGTACIGSARACKDYMTKRDSRNRREDMH